MKTNNNYLKGIRFERELVNKARKNGELAFRSAGSHSPIDVVSVNIANKIINLIQCKTGYMSTNELTKEELKFHDYNGTYQVIFKVLHKPGRKKRQGRKK